MMKKYLRNVILGIVIAAVGIFLIFTISSISYKLKSDDQILYISDDEVTDTTERIMKISTWVNETQPDGTEVRNLVGLTPDTPVRTGNLYGKRRLSELFGDYSDKTYDEAYIWSAVETDYKYRNPTITIEYDGKIECKYSVDLGEGWLNYGKPKNHLIDSEHTNADVSAVGNRSIAISPNVCGIIGVEYCLDNCSKEMQEYNERKKVDLTDVFPEVPKNLDMYIGDEIITYIFITAYDPADIEKINATAVLKVTYFRGGNVDYKKLITSGYDDILNARELSPFISITMTEYEQIERME